MNTRTAKRAWVCRSNTPRKRHIRLLDDDPGLLEEIKPCPSLDPYLSDDEWKAASSSFQRPDADEKLRPTRRLRAQLIDTRHQLVQTDMQPVSELDQVEIGRVRLPARNCIDLVQGQPAAVVSDRRWRHVLIFRDQNLDRLSKRGLILAVWFRLPFRWHGRKPYRSRARGVSQYIGYDDRRQSSTAHFAMTSSSDHAHLISLGRSITALRNEQGCTGTELATRTGLPRWVVTAMEEGRLDPDFALLMKLADALSTSLAEIVERASSIEEKEADHA
jgi:DNA-binding XRE family transcriptional regulator